MKWEARRKTQMLTEGSRTGGLSPNQSTGIVLGERSSVTYRAALSVQLCHVRPSPRARGLPTHRTRPHPPSRSRSRSPPARPPPTAAPAPPPPTHLPLLPPRGRASESARPYPAVAGQPEFELRSCRQAQCKHGNERGRGW